jgi:ElaB/YqjD/DUF883 family membrane-anchored ribosome-binding protein
MDSNNVEDNAADTAGRVKETARAFADDAKGRVDEISRDAQNAYAQVRDRVADASSVINESVQHQPLTALLVAGTLGCMLGLLLARR